MPRTLTPPLTKPPCLDAALEYARRGWSAIPLCPHDHRNCRSGHTDRCKKPGKAPLLANWQTKSLTFDELVAVWTANPTANVGVAMGPLSGIVALDIDGEEGAVFFAELCRRHDYRPASFQFSTGNGHRILFSLPEGEDPAYWKLVDDASKGQQAAELLSFLTASHQSVMPPSRHESGSEYLWIEGLRPGESSLDPCPDWLRNLNPHPSKKPFDLAAMENPHGRSDSHPSAPRDDVRPEDPHGNGRDTRREAVRGGGGRNRADAPGRPDAEQRARAYLARVEPCDPRPEHPMDASTHMLKAADALAVGFGLDDATACALLMEWDRASPSPYPAKEVYRKIEQARLHTKNAAGHLLGQPLRNGRNGAPPPPVPPNVNAEDPGEEPEDDEDKLPTRVEDIATGADLELAGAATKWVWPGWVARGVVTAVGADGGVGKTRWIADLMRRVRHSLPWPDGSPMTLPADTRWLWMLADDNHDEFVSLGKEWGFHDSYWVPARKKDPFAGTQIDGKIDRLREYLRILRPQFLVIDTLSSATSLKLNVQDEAEALFKPLRRIARDFDLSVLALTHLNASGGILGKRAIEKCRQVIKLSHPDKQEEDRRRLWMDKTNGKKPPALGITMGDKGNEYDDSPPDDPNAGPNAKASPRLAEAEKLMGERLPCLITLLRREWEDIHGKGTGTIFYRVIKKWEKEGKNVVEDEDGAGRKQWSLAQS